MRIIEIFASKTWGGGEQYVFDLSRKLIKDKHSVFFAGKKSEIIDQKLTSIHQPFYHLPLGWYFDLISIWKLAKLVRRETVNIIHVHHFKAAFIAVSVKILMRGKLKVILTRHLVRKGKNNFLYRFLYRHIDKIIFVSDLAKQRFLSVNPTIHPDKITVIFNSIYTEEREIILPNCTNTPLVVGFCGRLEKEKGVATLLAAIPLCKNKNINYLIAGSGCLEAKIRKMPHHYNIKMLGFQENIQEFVNQVDIGVTPTLIEEGFGLINLEFMQAGKPIITTNNGAQPEYITHNENGFLIEPNQPEQLAYYIDYLAEQPEKRTEIGENARQTFQGKLNYEIFYEKVMKVFV